MSNKKAMEFTGRTINQIENKGSDSKTLKAFEAKFEKMSQRSASSANTMRDTTDRLGSARDK